MGLSAIDVTPGRYCGGEDVRLFARDDQGTYLDLRAIPSRLSRSLVYKPLIMLLIITAFLCGLAYSWPQQTRYASHGGGPDNNGKYTLYADGIRAQFIPYGASITNLFINDTNGTSFDGLSLHFC